MALNQDTANLYNSSANHDCKMSWCAIWADYYNFLANQPWNTDVETAQFHEEMSEYLCYDV